MREIKTKIIINNASLFMLTDMVAVLNPYIYGMALSVLDTGNFENGQLKGRRVI